ncbi:MAG: hypothetical protein R2941_01965 [Desulfobacterales bacterium]
MLFLHKDQHHILKSEGMDQELSAVTVDQGHAGVCYKDGEYFKTLIPGQYLFWNTWGRSKCCIQICAELCWMCPVGIYDTRTR